MTPVESTAVRLQRLLDAECRELDARIVVEALFRVYLARWVATYPMRPTYDLTEGEPDSRHMKDDLTLHTWEDRHVVRVYELMNHNQVRAAAALGISNNTMRERLERLGLLVRQWPRAHGARLRRTHGLESA
jgi:transcriptional regulator with GAF, ATPase, and Fis domain